MTNVAQLRPGAKAPSVITKKIDGDAYDRIYLKIPQVEAMLHMLFMSMNCNIGKPSNQLMEDAIGGILTIVESVRGDFEAMVIEGEAA